MRTILQFLEYPFYYVFGPLTESGSVDLTASLFSILLWWSIFFGTSYWIENLITRKILKSEKLPAVKIKKAVFRANLYSYTFLLLLNFIFIFRIPQSNSNIIVPVLALQRPGFWAAFLFLDLIKAYNT